MLSELYVCVLCSGHCRLPCMLLALDETFVDSTIICVSRSGIPSPSLGPGLVADVVYINTHVFNIHRKPVDGSQCFFSQMT